MTEIDLTPEAGSTEEPRGRSVRNAAIVGVFVLVLGFVLFQAVTSASVYFYNVDEAVARRGEIGDQTFRLQGLVASEPVADAEGKYTFVVAFNGAEATVHHVGAEPTDLFERGIPVVAEGRWVGDTFQSDQLLIKHSEAYVADNKDRLDDVEAEVEAQADAANPTEQ